MKYKTFTTRAEAEAVKVTIRVISVTAQEVWLHTATNRQFIGTYTNIHDADTAATQALISACYDFDGPFNAEAWSNLVELVYASEQTNSTSINHNAVTADSH